MSTVWRYGVIAYGVKKRGRVEQRHVGGDSKCSIGEASGEPDKVTAERLAREWIAQNMKTCTRSFATAMRWESSDGGLMEETRPFEDTWNLRWELRS